VKMWPVCWAVVHTGCLHPIPQELLKTDVARIEYAWHAQEVCNGITRLVCVCVCVCVCVLMGGGRSFAFTLIPRQSWSDPDQMGCSNLSL
jgi:hypothetical protein